MTRRQIRLAHEAGAALVADRAGVYLASLGDRAERLALLCRCIAVLCAGAAAAGAIIALGAMP